MLWFLINETTLDIDSFYARDSDRSAAGVAEFLRFRQELQQEVCFISELVG